jgi:two-component system cell cycle response regulator
MIPILLIEDNPGDARLVQEALKEAPESRFQVIWRDCLRTGLKRIDDDDIRLILLDLTLPDSSGLNTVDVVSKRAGGIPILVLTGLDDKYLALEAVRCGAQDYLVKEKINPDMLERCIRYAIERQQLLDEIRASSFIDPLTGLQNRRGFVTFAQRDLKLAQRQHTGMLLFFIDVDGLKLINDQFGHQQGDKALIEFADILKSACRETDLIARIGGDEFLISLKEDNELSAETLAERIQNKLDQRNQQSDRLYELSASMGIAVYEPGRLCSIDELIAEADKLMYERKKAKKSMMLTKGKLDTIS